MRFAFTIFLLAFTVGCGNDPLQSEAERTAQKYRTAEIAKNAIEKELELFERDQEALHTINASVQNRKRVLEMQHRLRREVQRLERLMQDYSKQNK